MRDSQQLDTPHRSVDCTDVVRAVAEREGVDPTNLEPRLYDVINPDALDTLLATATTDAQSPIIVRFEYAGYTVVVDSDGTLVVE
ncbi:MULTISPECIES: HalOD1 output domain-containing protein [Haloferax]|uniref:Halobacterial output domain-containing protein n=2 Tax=Haloferax TaxID=2251 RepID=A0A6G1Z4N7_9EURY|nr:MULTISPECIES: HalOD1 output domain-containing protein [Haloferax]KAB1188656.1 hypothetical protein Hfx1149_11655 [Haloferax sp. CBA1149]MRW81361.1 hypothetical protein [Haloferax marinisediminis]